MMNEAHNGLLRCVRTRRVGRQILPAAHAAGVRYLTMEALWDRQVVEIANRERALPPIEDGYLAQPEMRELVDAALNLGWTLVAYEAEMERKPAAYANLSREETNWREAEQGRNLAEALAALPGDAKMLVWCGNSHLLKQPYEDWHPMGFRFAEAAGFEAFAIDQTGSVEFEPGLRRGAAARLADYLADKLTAAGGTLGFIDNEAPPNWPRLQRLDGTLLSVENSIE